jgi:CIC family chloride channel protein
MHPPFSSLQDAATMSHAARRAPGRAARPGDFTTDGRVLLLVSMALAVGVGSTIAAFALIKLIALVTNLIWFGHFSFEEASPAMASPSLWMVLVRGHGIPEPPRPMP